MGNRRRKEVYLMDEVVERFGLTREFLDHCVQASWIHAAVPEKGIFDEEDLSRARLIHELQADFGVNDESIPLILHLLDQIYYLEALIRRAESAARNLK
jgi:chaperone modulatory protein CbpM